ncbi:MAG: DUF29 domain-containing protein [Gammaproteobacteria bacterium]|nr:DUF29 domain-containing protein [Gammaproteobacteria bacterium]
MQDAKAPRYEEDFYSWSLDQANRLRQLQMRVGNDSQGVDFENVIEEVEDLSGQVRRILTGHIRQVITHMGAIAYTHPDRAATHISHWLREIEVFRSNIIDTLDENPGLKGQLDQLCNEQWRRSISQTVQKVQEVGELSNAQERELRERINQESPPSAEEILGFDWQLHEQRSDKTIDDYFKEDSDAPRFPVFLHDALRRIHRLAQKGDPSRV